MLKLFAASLMTFGLMSGVAHAKILTSGMVLYRQTIGTATASFQLKPNATFLEFSSLFGGTISVSFSAECAVEGSNQRLHIAVFVDGIAVEPKFPQMILCSPDPTAALDAYQINNFEIPVTIKIGKHRLQVKAHVAGSTGGVWLDEVSTVISD